MNKNHVNTEQKVFWPEVFVMQFITQIPPSSKKVWAHLPNHLNDPEWLKIKMGPSNIYIFYMLLSFQWPYRNSLKTRT